jgi:hypothetical protein
MWKRPVVEERMTEVAMVVGQCSYWSGKLGVDEADHLYWHEQLVVVLLAAAAAAAASFFQHHTTVGYNAVTENKKQWSGVSLFLCGA